VPYHWLDIDRKTDANITRAILLQVIADQEQRGPSLLTESFLSQVIRAYRGASPDAVRELLERGIAQFRTPQGGADAA
jgi:polyhydroxyalkanoate synthesis regulator protein